MILADTFYLDVARIHIVHEFVLDRVHKCEYPQGRGHYGLVYVQSGEAEFRFFDGQRIMVGEGDVLFLSPSCAYFTVAQKQCKHYTVNFDIHEGSSDLSAIDTPYCLLREKSKGGIEWAFKELVGTWKMKKVNYQMQSLGRLYELIAQFYLEYTNEHGAPSYQRLLDAKEYIEQHFERPVTLQYLAFLSNMSVTNFRREWKKNYPESPIRYRDNIRLYYAKEYLNSGYYSVTEIAKKCGFEDASYFVRFFKKKTGLTPGEFKKKT